MAAMIRFFCRKCAQRIKVQEAFAGKVVRCPKCGEMQTSPNATASPEASKRASRSAFNDDIEPMGGYDSYEGDDASEPAFPVDFDESSSETDVDLKTAGELSELASAVGLDAPVGDTIPDQPSHFPAVDEDDAFDGAMMDPRPRSKRSPAASRSASQSVARSRSTTGVSHPRRSRKKGGHGFLIGGIVLLVLVVAAAIIVMVILVKNRDKIHGTVPTPESTPAQVEPESTSSATDEVYQPGPDVDPDAAN